MTSARPPTGDVTAKSIAQQNARERLTEALEAEDSAKKDYLIRETLQLLRMGDR
ncbi:hypothetical protein KTS45_03390 [Halomicroarcula limicola]|uniref:Uncharacterized protein n=1 Tax=Haloarcula limicola TaxID=1429915 RepID=A0A8J8C5X8_9EURY|nr:hypothetical protein [Halomicroarcula limicola]MBV0923233.1 hypothetical protein [Halomicroarcula limicola]